MVCTKAATAEVAEERVGGPGGGGLAGQGSRALQLPGEYLGKARAADRQGMQQGEVGRVEARLGGMGTVRRVVSGKFGEMSEDTHLLVAAIVARPALFSAAWRLSGREEQQRPGGSGRLLRSRAVGIRRSRPTASPGDRATGPSGPASAKMTIVLLIFLDTLIYL